MEAVKECLCSYFYQPTFRERWSNKNYIKNIKYRGTFSCWLFVLCVANLHQKGENKGKNQPVFFMWQRKNDLPCAELERPLISLSASAPWCWSPTKCYASPSKYIWAMWVQWWSIHTHRKKQNTRISHMGRPWPMFYNLPFSLDSFGWYLQAIMELW